MKDKNLAALLAFFFGGIGAHKFYLGQIGWGVLYFIFCWTFIPQFVAFIEFIMLALMDEDEFNRRFNGSNMLQARPVMVNMLPPGPYGQIPYAGYGPYGPASGPGVGTAPGQPKPDLATQLEKLHELRVAGLLTDDEFKQQKAKLLDSM